MTAQTPPFEPREISPDVAEYFSQLAPVAAPIPQTSPLAEPAPVAVELDDTAASWLAALRYADEQIALQTGIRSRAIEHLQAAMGDATEATINGRPAVSWKPAKPSMRLDRKALETAYGADVIAGFCREAAPSRPFKVLPADGDL